MKRSATLLQGAEYFSECGCLAAPARTKHAEEIATQSRKTKRDLSAAGPRMGIIETSTSTSTRRAREES
jgi:hypothetical protein